jgi:predicted dinucleotide-binding enzyme
MTTAIIGTGGLGSAVARLLAAGGETLRLASADSDAARTLAAEVGRGASVASDNRDALQDVDAVILALRFTVLKSVIDEIALSLSEKMVIVPSNPLRTDDQGNVVRVLPEGKSSGEAVAEWLPVGVPFAMAFGSMSADLLKASSNRSPEPVVLFYASDGDHAGTGVERLIRTAGFDPLRVGGSEQSTRFEVGGDLHDVVVSLTEARSLMDGP